MRLSVKVVPGSSRAAVLGRFGEGWRVAVTAAPERGKANAAVEILLAAALELPRAAVTVVVGHSQARKQVEIEGLDSAEVDRRLTTAVR